MTQLGYSSAKHWPYLVKCFCCGHKYNSKIQLRHLSLIIFTLFMPSPILSCQVFLHFSIFIYIYMYEPISFSDLVLRTVQSCICESSLPHIKKWGTLSHTSWAKSTTTCNIKVCNLTTLQSFSSNHSEDKRNFVCVYSLCCLYFHLRCPSYLICSQMLCNDFSLSAISQ